MTLAELLLVMGVDKMDLDAGMREAEAQVNRSAERMQKSLEQVGKGLMGLGQKLSLFVTAPLAFLGRTAIKAAMDVVESENLFEVSMGNMAGAARKWSEEVSKALGLNAYEVRRNVGMLNTMLLSMGLGEKAALEMSEGLTQLAYDMASFYNLQPEEAFQKLRAGIVGETEPLRQLGILVLENTTKQYAYKAGIAETGKELSEGQKVLARYGSIMEQTAKAQGDLARTMTSPANQARIQRARFELLQIEVGQKLLPVYIKFMQAVSKLTSIFIGLPEPVKSAVVYFLALVAAVGPLLVAFGAIVVYGPKVIAAIKGFSIASIAASWVTKLGQAFQFLYLAMVRNPIIAVVMVIAGALLHLALSSERVSKWLDQVIARLRALAGLDYQPPVPPESALSAYEDLSGFLKDAASGIEDVGKSGKKAAKENEKFLAAFDEVYQVAEKNQGALDDLAGAIGGIGLPPAGGGPGAGAGPGGAGAAIQIPKVPPVLPPIQWKGLIPPPGAVADAVDVMVERIGNAIRMLPVVVSGAAQGAWNAVTGKLAAFPDWVMEKIRQALGFFGELPVGVQAAIAAAVGAVQSIFPGIGPIVRGVIDRVLEIFRGLPGNILGAIVPLLPSFAAFLPRLLPVVSGFLPRLIGIFGGIPGLVISVVGPLVPRFLGLLGRILPGVGPVISRIVGFFRGLPGQAVSAIASLPGRVGGILGRLPGLAANAVNGIVNYFKGMPGRIWDAIKGLGRTIGGWFSGLLRGGPAPAFAVPGAQAGGIFDRPAIIGIAEKEPEAAIPLSRLEEMIGGGGGGEVHLHVGVLVADERGLKELERLLRRVRIAEAGRVAE